MLSRVRGTADVVGSGCLELSFLEAQGRLAARLAGFEEIRTPVLEHADLFARSLGEGSDVVSKEMFTLDDRSNRKLALRPEGTAGVARAMMTDGWRGLPKGVFYHGAMFRYERPQHGRQRQFTQFGVEHIGCEGVSADLLVVDVAHDFLRRVGLAENCRLLINSLGCVESRQRFSRAIAAHLEPFAHLGGLSEDSKRRLSEGRALRILDSKDPQDQAAIAHAPKAHSCLTQESQSRFERFKQGLGVLGIPFEEDPRLVRGLDYYTHTIFEFVTATNSAGGALRPSALLAGGRYDGLAKTLGAPEVPAIGWAAGLERISLERERLGLSSKVSEEDRVLVVALLETRADDPQQLDEAKSSLVRDHCLRLCSVLRREADLAAVPWNVAMDATAPVASLIKKAFKAAEASGCSVVAIVGAEEAATNAPALATYKHLRSGKQQKIKDTGLLRAFIQQL